MPDYRQIHTEIWSDPWFELLDPRDKLLFIYLFSNKRSTLAGLYDISVRQIAFDTGLEEQYINEAMARFAEADKAHFDGRTVWIPKMMERNAQNLRSPKTQANIRHTFLVASNGPLLHKAIGYFNAIIAPKYGIDTLSMVYLQNKTKQNTTQQNTGSADADGDSPDPVEPIQETEQRPITFQEWQARIQNTKNRPAELVSMFSVLYPGRDPPDFGYIGKVARSVGGAGRLADLLWQHSTRPPTGDVLAYIQAIAKGDRKDGNGIQPVQPIDADEATRLAFVEHGRRRRTPVETTGPP